MNIFKELKELIKVWPAGASRAAYGDVLHRIESHGIDMYLVTVKSHRTSGKIVTSTYHFLKHEDAVEHMLELEKICIKRTQSKVNERFQGGHVWLSDDKECLEFDDKSGDTIREAEITKINVK